LQRTASTANVTGDGTAYTVVWNNEIVDALSDFSSDTFTARTTGYHKFSFNCLVFSLHTNITSVSCEFVASGRTYLAFADSRDFGADEQVQIEFSTNFLMAAGDTITMWVKATGGAKTVYLDGGPKYARMTIEYLGNI
jgi:hypothetical protein